MERGRGGGPPDTTPLGQAVAHGKVSSVEEDYIVLPMTLPSECNNGTCGLWGLNAIEAVGLWTKVPDPVLALPRATFRGAVIDTGAQFKHVQLVGQLDSGTSRGYKRGAIASAADTDGHGTHTSTTVAGNWNNDPQGGIAGIVDNVDLVACKFLFAGGGTTSDAVLCLDYLRAKNITISNNSWGGGGSSSALLAAIKAVCKEGGLFVVAAGNDGVDITAGRYPAYPAAYVTEPGAECVLPVAAANHTGTLASWSNWGLAVPLSAPGVLIRSAIYSKTSNTREAEWSGTSMAAPHVTGVALMLKHAFPNLNGTHIKEAMVSTATKMPYTGVAIKGGLLNATKAYERAWEINNDLPKVGGR
jgi:subtilisin family serine protease